MQDDIVIRVRRLCAAVDSTVERDMSKLPAKVISTEKGWGVFQDFSGGRSSEELENDFFGIINNLANLEYLLEKWAHHNGRDKTKVRAVFTASRSLQIVHDLWNWNKHGPARNSDGTRSKLAPTVRNIRRDMTLQTLAKKGSWVTMTLGPGGIPQKDGDGTAEARITGDVVDNMGQHVGDARKIILDAVTDCERLMREYGLMT